MGKYRIKEYDGKGWIVEYKESVWGFFGLVHRWRHVTHYMGLESTPYYYSTPEEARDGALDEIKGEINFTFYYPWMA